MAFVGPGDIDLGQDPGSARIGPHKSARADQTVRENPAADAPIGIRYLRPERQIEKITQRLFTNAIRYPTSPQ
jgi:hypothetical protein